ncbi:MAG: 3-dehydroquinate synthase [Lentimicrobium sp.]
MRDYNEVKCLEHSIIIIRREKVFTRLLSNLPFDRLLILCDINTWKYCFHEIVPALSSKSCHIHIIEAGEESKNLSTLEGIWETLSNEGFRRNDAILNLGGGVVCDIGGLAAATFQRGMQFIHVPTTLLAMVDAAIGGKNAINFEGLKNQIGVFAFPYQTFIYPKFLRTLPYRQIRSGFVEMLKHALLKGDDLWNRLSAIEPEEVMHHLLYISEAIKVKVSYVDEDPFDQGIRQALNFGHTAGHAFEEWSLLKQPQPMLHGEAIALGMLVELELSVKLTGLDDNFALLASNIFKKYIHFPIPTLLDIEQLIDLAGFDKKNKDQSIRFSLLQKTGKPVVQVAVSRETLSNVLKNIILSFS